MELVGYLATSRMIASLQRFSKPAVRLHGTDNLPRGGGLIFVVDGASALERMLLPLHLSLLTKRAVWSLADSSRFSGMLEFIGAEINPAVDPDLDVVRTLLAGEANWVVFPSEAAVHEQGASHSSWRSSPHELERTAATLALRTEIYRQCLLGLPPKGREFARLKELFGLGDLEPVLQGSCWLVPVHIACHPLRLTDQVLRALSDLENQKGSLREREGGLTRFRKLVSALEVAITFGEAIEAAPATLTPAVDAALAFAKANSAAGLPALPELGREAKRLARRCRSSLRRLTPMSLDHLMAALLKATPFPIPEEEFRRRAFLLSARCKDLPGIHLHRSLDHALTILTDDRRRAYQDFLLLAQEKKVARLGGGKLARNRGGFGRGANQLAELARQVRRFPTLQAQVHLMAWLPGWVVRSRIAEVLERQALDEFDADYREYYIEHESKERGVGTPVLLKGASRKVGVVLVHGFLSAPREMAELARHLNSRGFWVYQLRLKGHGTSPPDLAGRVCAEWRESVDLGYVLMSSVCRRVVLGGFSFGAGVALDCASRVPEVAAVFAVCPPLRLVDISSRFAPAVHGWNRLMDTFQYQWAKMEFVVTVPERPHINYSRLPVSGVRELGRFMRDLEGRLSRIEAPTLVLQADGDPVVDPKGSRLLYELLGSKDKEYRRFPFSRHGILAGPGSEEVHAVIASFVEEV